MMKPILFNTDMVRAVLEGRKTVTRRVVKPQPHCYGPNIAYPKHEADFAINQKLNRLQCQTCGTFPKYSREMVDNFHFWNPPHRPGDILYVRETWAPWSRTEGTAPEIHYKADGETLPGIKWRPSIQMPREAARIFLRVTDVRVERLQDITDDGIVRDFDFCAEALKIMDTQQKNVACMALWDSTIKKADRALCGWDANPWVWVIEFERCERPEGGGENV